MKLKNFGITALVTAGMAVFPSLMVASTTQSCPTGEPTPGSNTWNFKKEASQLLKGLQGDAAEAESSAAALKQYALTPALSWEAHGEQLDSIKAAINDLGSKLCRLETIERMLDPWQQKAIDGVLPPARVAAANANEAIAFLNSHMADFWLPDYKKYVDTIYTETRKIANSVHEYQVYAKIHRKDVNLRENLGLSAGS